MVLVHTADWRLPDVIHITGQAPNHDGLPPDPLFEGLGCANLLPRPHTPADDYTWATAWFVREAWPSPITGTSLTEGVLEVGGSLRITVASDQLVVFGDGMEADRLTASCGQKITVHLGARPLRLVR